MSQTRREAGVDSPFDASKIEFYTRERRDLPREETMEQKIAETQEFYASYTGTEDTLRDV